MRRYGILHDVPGDGSCGYHCIMLLLHRMKLIDITLSVTQFRQGILEFIQSNMTNFIGVHPDGNDAVFQYTWGDMSRPNKRRCNPVATRTKFITKEVMNGIWSNHVDYSLPVKKAHWMDSAYLFLSLLTNIKSENLSCMTIVVQIQLVLTVDVVLQLVCIVMTNPNVKYPSIQYRDSFMTLMQLEMPVWFTFVINHISML